MPALDHLLKRMDETEVFISRNHSDGSTWEGWFIAGMVTEHGQLTYHIPDRLWEYCKGIPELDRAPEWDGHSSDDVIERLKLLAGVK